MILTIENGWDIGTGPGGLAYSEVADSIEISAPPMDF